MVYVLDQNGQPLMPTKRYGKVRHLLKDGRAKIVGYRPFIIQLMYESPTYTQPVSLGVNAGSRHIGISATTEKKEFYAADIELRNDIVKLLAARRECRRSRGNRWNFGMSGNMYCSEMDIHASAVRESQKTRS